MFWPIVGPLLFFAAGLVTFELIGVARKNKGDTMTELVRAVLARLPGPVRLGARLMLAGLGLWAALHLGFDLV